MFQRIQRFAWRTQQSRAFSGAALLQILLTNVLFFFVVPMGPGPTTAPAIGAGRRIASGRLALPRPSAPPPECSAPS